MRVFIMLMAIQLSATHLGGSQSSILDCQKQSLLNQVYWRLLGKCSLQMSIRLNLFMNIFRLELFEEWFLKGICPSNYPWLFFKISDEVVVDFGFQVIK